MKQIPQHKSIALLQFQERVTKQNKNILYWTMTTYCLTVADVKTIILKKWHNIRIELEFKEFFDEPPILAIKRNKNLKKWGFIKYTNRRPTDHWLADHQPPTHRPYYKIIFKRLDDWEIFDLQNTHAAWKMKNYISLYLTSMWIESKSS